MLLFHIILRIARVIFNIDDSVDLITPIFKYVLAVALVLVFLFNVFSRLYAAKTAKTLSEYKAALDISLKAFYAEVV